MNYKLLTGLILLISSLVLLVGGIGGQANATPIVDTFAQATFDFSVPGTLTITLTETFANPTSVAQLLSGVSFDLSVGGVSTLTGSSGQEITVNSNGTYSLGSTVSTGWALGAFGTGSILCVICSSNPPIAPAHLLIGAPSGSNIYSSANGSILGNGPHNPFLNQTATFTISNSLFTTGASVSDVVFHYGTTFSATTPEPASLLLLGAALVSLGIWRRKVIKI